MLLSSLIFSVILVSLALCVDSFVISAAVSLGLCHPLQKRMRMALVFALFQGLFPLLGALLGKGFHDLIASVDHWVAFALLLFVGGKMVVDALFGSQRRRDYDISRFGTLALLGVATSIDAFVVGIGWGLEYGWLYVLFAVAVVTVFTFMASMLGSWMGGRRIPVPERVSSVMAGLVLIGLGAWTLCEHLWMA